jgi:DNA ligase (NAD+)
MNYDIIDDNILQDKIKLLELIKKADDEYYNHNNPTLSDTTYDTYRNYYLNHYDKKDLDYVPGNVSDKFEHFNHPYHISSLDKVKETDKNKLFKITDKLFPIIIEPKYDGLTVVAYPDENGKCKFVTRGFEGKVGDVLPNFISKYEVNGINNSTYPVRGEVYMDTETFNQINDELKSLNEELFKNKRNAAAGILHNKERSPYLDKLKYITYDLLGYPDEQTENEKLQYLNDYTKFDVTEYVLYDKDKSSIFDYVLNYYDKRKNGNIPIDGVVLKSNQKNSLERFGSTKHHKNNAIAWKGTPDSYQTKIINIVWQVGRERLTPVAILNPVEIDGTIVTKASVHNWGNIEKLHLCLNDDVIVEKSNEIIPQIIKNCGNGTGKIFEKPDKCPICGHDLLIKKISNSKFGNDVEILCCSNDDCLEKIAQNIAYLGHKNILNIDGLSLETARKIVFAYKDNAINKRQNMIFDLSCDQIESLDGFAKKSAKTLYDNIQKILDGISLDKFISACCILNIGNDISLKLAKKYHTYDNIFNVCCKLRNENDLREIKGLGNESVKILISDKFKNAITGLYQYVHPEDYICIEINNDCQYHIAITGKFEFPRSKYEEMIVKSGNIIDNSVTSSTTHLMIANINSTSSKAQKARKLGVTLIDEQGLYDLLNMNK